MATYNADATIRKASLIPSDTATSFSGALRASALVILLMSTLLIVSALLAAPSASAQQLYGDRKVILENLACRYSETPRVMGLSADGKVIDQLKDTAQRDGRSGR